MIKPTVFCDVCQRPKADVNHWYVIRVMSSAGEQIKLWVETWDKDSANMPNALHLCGAECVIKKVNEFLGSK